MEKITMKESPRRETRPRSLMLMVMAWKTLVSRVIWVTRKNMWREKYSMR